MNTHHEKLDSIANKLGLDEEEKEKAHLFLEKSLQDMEIEDPEKLIYCSCHGELNPQKDVDVWGYCPYGR